MKTLLNILLISGLLIFSFSCSVISKSVRQEAMSPQPFANLIEEADNLKGKTVIVGGYILSSEFKDDVTVMVVIQAPLGIGEEPVAKDKTEGRLVVRHNGFLDPEIYKTERRITVAGTIIGREEGTVSCPDECLVLVSREIYLWPEYEYYYRHYDYDPFFYYPYPYRYSYPYWYYPPRYYRPYWYW